MLNKEISRQYSPEGYTKDGRLPVWNLYQSFERLEEEFGWIRETVYIQELKTPQGILKFPIEVYRTPLWGNAFWVFAGIHGEEPAGPNALAQNVEVIADLGKKISMVVFPLCNPSGYFRDWRYTNEQRDRRKGESVGDCEHLLPQLEPFELKPRYHVWSCPEAYYLPFKIVDLAGKYHPLVVVDHHEDESLDMPYIYSQGKLGAKDPIAKKVVEILKKCGMSIFDNGEAILEGRRVKISGGIVDASINDSSIDELLVSEWVFVNGEWKNKKPADHLVVVETPALLASLKKRVSAHFNIIACYEEFWRMANL